MPSLNCAAVYFVANRNTSKQAVADYTNWFTMLNLMTADERRGIVAGFGLTAVSDWLIDYQQWLRVAGGCYLLYMGGRAFAAEPPAELESERDPESLLGDFASTFVLALNSRSWASSRRSASAGHKRRLAAHRSWFSEFGVARCYGGWR